MKDLTGISSPGHFNFVIEYCNGNSAAEAAVLAGFSPDYGNTLRQRPEIDAAIQHIMGRRLQVADIDREWVLMEMVDNHRIARHQGKISASNAALALIAKHAQVDAFAADKVIAVRDESMVERLQRGRARLAAVNQSTVPEIPDPSPMPESFL